MESPVMFPFWRMKFKFGNENTIWIMENHFGD
jgi:hypothetical protein